MLYEYLVTAFGFNEPIFTSDIQFEDYSKIWIAKELSKLCEKNNLFDMKEAFTIFLKTPFDESVLNPNKVIERKYLSDKGKNRILYGYYRFAASRIINTDFKCS